MSEFFHFHTYQSVDPGLVPSHLIEALGLEHREQTGFDYVAYADGACSGNGAKRATPGGWGALALCKSGAALVGLGGAFDTTNNQMELTAVLQLLHKLPPGVSVLVRTDSQYVVKGCTEWRAGWVKKGYRNSKGEPVANLDLWKALWTQCDLRKVQFSWVKGHNGHPGNEIADHLASKAASQH